MPAKLCGGLPHHTKEIQPEWLTDRLREHGVLPTGNITSINVEVGELWNVAVTARIAMAYDQLAPPCAPSSLFVKIRETADPYEETFAGGRCPAQC